MLAKTYGAAVIGVQAHVVTIEVSVVRGTKLFMSGLADKAVKESEHRVQAALTAEGFSMPRSRVIINLAPADMRKEGSAYDLPLALGVLAASGQIKLNFEGRLIMGELALDGTLLPIRGALCIAQEAAAGGFQEFILPSSNAKEASVVRGIAVVGAGTLGEALAHLSGARCLPREVPTAVIEGAHISKGMDFSDVQGQETIKRALEIAAAGGHNVLLIGPPGAGKTMLARRIPSILPPLAAREAIETTKIHSVAGKLTAHNGLVERRPFRSPHHTTSDVALVGGGAFPVPGEISLAHNGVLFLDELPEFKRSVLEVLRQPMEERRVTISRARMSLDYPANFMLIASMNPCPCGFYNHPEKSCSCSPGMVRRYLTRISGPLLDRIDLHVEVTPVSIDCMVDKRESEGSRQILARVNGARLRQMKRFGAGVRTNAVMSISEMRKHCVLDKPSRMLVRTAMEKLGLSARAYDRIIKVSRTIADLDGAASIGAGHIAEAIQFRSLDRDNWGI